MSKKIVLYPLIISIICHFLFLYSDRIYNNFFLVLSITEKTHLSTLEKNIAKIKSLKENLNKYNSESIEYKESLEELLSKFEDEKQQYLSKVADSHRNGKSKKVSDNQEGVETSVLDEHFGKFSSKNQIVKQKNSANNQNFSVFIIAKNSYKSPEKCEASYYGIGLNLTTNFKVSGVSDYSDLAKKLNIKIGDYLLGFKNSNNQFYEGNSLIPLIQKNYKNEYLTIILKQNGKIIETPIVLDSICYERKHDSLNLRQQ